MPKIIKLQTLEVYILYYYIIIIIYLFQFSFTNGT